MRSFVKKITHPFLEKWSQFYFSKPRKYTYKSIDGIVLPHVFHPQLTLSTKILLDFLSTKTLQSSTFLELGCGTGLIAVLAAQQGATVWATDINPAAIENVTLNAERNQVEINVLRSDLFDEIPSQQFDVVVINPPYYPKDPTTDAEKAWFCGQDFEYFTKLFKQLGGYVGTTSSVYMILSEDCELERIQGIARTNNFHFTEVFRIQKMREWNLIFEISIH